MFVGDIYNQALEYYNAENKNMIILISKSKYMSFRYLYYFISSHRSSIKENFEMRNT